MITSYKPCRIGTIVTCLLAAPMMAMPSSQAVAGAVDVGGGWTATAPNGYDMAPDVPAGGNLGDLVPLGNSTTLALPTKLVVANWTSLDNVCITFTNSRKAADPPHPDHIALRLEITNKTNKDWAGFKMTITDNNNTPKDGAPNLTHPFYSHYHMYFQDANATAPFMKVKVTPDYENGPAAIGPDLTDRGVYSMEFSDGCVMKNDTWSAKTIDLHDRAKQAPNGDYITSFTICLMPIPKAVIPEPASATLLGLSALSLRQRRRKGTGRPI